MLMKTITNFILPRYVWFRVWFSQWFKNPHGIKGFADLMMNELVQKCMSRFKGLNAVIARCTSSLATIRQSIEVARLSNMVSIDDFSEVRGTVRSYRFWIFVTLISDVPFNYFLFDAAYNMDGLGAVIFKAVASLVLTVLVVLPAAVLCYQLIGESKYGVALKPKRNWVHLALLTAFLIVGEVMIYKMCLVRGKLIEGASGDGSITFGLLMFGMLSPLIAGYLMYRISLVIDALNNYCTLSNLLGSEARLVKQLAKSHDEKLSIFKQAAQEKWSVLQEFKVYKNNYDLRRQQQESLDGHYSESHDSFMREASYRLESRELDSSVIINHTASTYLIAKTE